MKEEQRPSSGSNGVEIRRGRVDSLSIFEITEAELDSLAKGSPGSIFLNFGIFLLSVGTSFLATLLTVEIASLFKFAVFVVLATVGLVGGAFLLLLWRRLRHEVEDVVSKIRDRVDGPTRHPAAG